MFQALGNAVSRIWPLLLLGWGGLLAATWVAAPEWEEVARAGEFVFLPDDAPTRRGEELFEQAFPEDAQTAQVVIVLHRPEGERELLDQDREFVKDRLAPALKRLAGDAESKISQVRTPEDEDVGLLLTSPDERAMLVLVDLTTEFLAYSIVPPVDRIEELVEELRRDGAVPDGLEIALSGSAVLGRDRTRAKAESAEAIQSWTIWLVIALLLIVYRAPLVALIPLVTLYLTVRLTLNLLAIMAQAELIGVFQGLEVYTIVLVYGAGVDYSMFIIARFREELEKGAAYGDAIAGSIGRVGSAVSASAATEIIGIGMLSFAQFGKFQQAGISISLGLLVMFCASLTLTPGLLRLTGRWAFWPWMPGRELHTASAEQTGGERLHKLAARKMSRGLWERIGTALARRPATIWLACVAALAPLAAVGILRYQDVSYGLVAELPQDRPVVHGTDVLTRHFPAGVTGPATVLIRNDDVDFGSGRGMGFVEDLTDRLARRRDDLGIVDLRSISDPLGLSEQAEQVLAMPEGTVTQRVTRRAEIRRRAIEHYVSDGGELDRHVTRLELVLDIDPFSREAIRRIEEVERAVANALPGPLEGSQVHLLGATASLRDLKNVAEEDRLWIKTLVAASVLLVLIVLLRRFALPLYLIVTVLFSYAITFGVTFLVFRALEPDRFTGLDWTVPLFLFTVLVAVGIDYNIYLITRIVEERERHGPVGGVTEALNRTGAIISSCGIIMAGTFSTLAIGGELASMRQLGFALAFGILLDTFVVRPVLVPAMLIWVADRRERRFLNRRERR